MVYNPTLNKTGFGLNSFGLNPFGLDTQEVYGNIGSGLGGQSERVFYQVRVPGATAQTGLNELKTRYWHKYLGDSFATDATFAELERAFLKRFIVNQGGTPSNVNYLSTLWREAVAVIGATPATNMSENKRLFFNTVAT